MDNVGEGCRERERERERETSQEVKKNIKTPRHFIEKCGKMYIASQVELVLYHSGNLLVS